MSSNSKVARWWSSAGLSSGTSGPPALKRPRIPLRATYRVQLHAGFGFDDAAAIVGYLTRLGISHLYCSPYLQARARSTHGYDVVDHGRVNEELGGAEAHKRLLAALDEHGMGHLLDIVPNHMAVNDPANVWWWDVLKLGSGSRYASFFDIDWDPPGHKLRRQILVPILGDHYGRVLEAGEIELEHRDGESVVRYHDHLLPLAPGTALGDIRTAQRDVEALHEVLELQHYRLAHWRVASEELNYRRFFAINDLAGLRAENPEVFRRTHALVLELVDRGELQGLRIDHIDGLRRPDEYLAKLRAAAPGSYIVVEKILEGDESLPDWPVQGTTGYDFLNRVNGLFVDSSGAGALTSVYETFTGDVADLDDQRRDKKLAIAHTELASDLERLTDSLSELCEGQRRYRDYTRRELRSALAETMAAFPVYRTYVNPVSRTVTPTDERVISGAIAVAKDRRADLEPELFELLSDILLLRTDAAAAHNLALRFQQVTGPIMAKGIEDTLFFTYNRLTSLNEVGGDPGDFGVSLEDFHRHNQRAQRNRPLSMLATSTHDTKRSEDVRVRISLLSEIPARWAGAVGRWSEMNMRHRTRNLPSRGDEYLLYQTLVGAWPLSVERATGYMTKAAKEARLHTSWIDADEEYDAALVSFVRAALSDAAFVAELEEFVAPLVEPGRIASLSQTLIKLTAPGVPDVYQGCELWDLSLVDPDNRRRVHYERRRVLLEDVAGGGPPLLSDDGAAKLFLLQRALAVRAELPQAFGESSTYEPLHATGDAAERVVAFLRGNRVVTVVPRLTLGLPDMKSTTLELPAGAWSDRLSGRSHRGAVALDDLWSDFPVSLLTRDDA
ncbi:MAG: malto-oligosyltrehalose synthase [Actinomycetota bacterium]